MNERAELTIAWRFTAVVLGGLSLAKSLSSVPFLGTVLVTGASFIQLYLPLKRADKLGLGDAFVGLHRHTWRRDVQLVGYLCLIFFPLYALLHHLYLTHLHQWLVAYDLQKLAQYVPHRTFAPLLPNSLWQWAAGIGWLAKIALTHLIGVALPEETFYRGYLQARLQACWEAKTQILGVPIGKGACTASFFFALGHFLGEWNPLRFGPFFPGLIFAWLRNATGSILGAILFHGLCNIFGELLFVMYR